MGCTTTTCLFPFTPLMPYTPLDRDLQSDLSNRGESDLRKLGVLRERFRRSVERASGGNKSVSGSMMKEVAPPCMRLR
ncbi:hypothetical protein L6452_20323 [Arctium lappa]|uniref:Uncharacterized protein n=1 Tax=Arctium lappa TaxID=4217 RepID=A0ACB9BFF6_ARCLA|nr:hypothetical protein L6452_20323 [Arctium lappa]